MTKKHNDYDLVDLGFIGTLSFANQVKKRKAINLKYITHDCDSFADSFNIFLNPDCYNKKCFKRFWKKALKNQTNI